MENAKMELQESLKKLKNVICYDLIFTPKRRLTKASIHEMTASLQSQKESIYAYGLENKCAVPIQYSSFSFAIQNDANIVRAYELAYYIAARAYPGYEKDLMMLYITIEGYNASVMLKDEETRKQCLDVFSEFETINSETQRARKYVGGSSK